MKHLIPSFLLSLLFTSCNYHLTDKAKGWNPYKAGDILVFESNDNQSDTFVVTEIKNTFSGNNEIQSVECAFIQHNALSPQKVDTVHSWLMALTAWENGKAVLSINLNTKTLRFAPFNAKPITWLDSLPLSSVGVSNNYYNDVIEISPDNNFRNSEKYINDSLFVNKIFWSKSVGLIKYELKHKQTIWTLRRKYSL